MHTSSSGSPGFWSRGLDFFKLLFSSHMSFPQVIAKAHVLYLVPSVYIVLQGVKGIGVYQFSEGTITLYISSSAKISETYLA